MSEMAQRELPEGWKLLPIRNLGKAITGNTPPTKDADNYNGEIPFIKPTELVGKPVSTGRETISCKGAEKSRILPKGGVLVSCIGNLGKTAIAKRDIAFNQQINAIIFNDLIIPEYGFYYFQTLKFRKDLASLASATTISIVNKSKFESINVPVAPLDQQKRIVAKIEEIFSHIDAGVEGLKKTQRLLKQYRQSVLKAAVTGELTKEWREENRDKLELATELLGKILEARHEKQKGKYKEPKTPAMFVSLNCPEDWVIASVDQVADVSLGKMLDKSKHTAGNRLSYLRNINVRWGSVDTDDLSEMFFKDSELERYGVENGDVLVCEGGEPGRAAVWTGSHANMKYQKALHRVRFHVPLIPQYLVYLLEYFASTGLLERYFTGSTIKHFTRESFVSMPFPLPSLIEMKKIVELVEEKMFSMNRLKREIDLQLARAERNKQSILASAFSKQLSIR